MTEADGKRRALGRGLEALLPGSGARSLKAQASTTPEEALAGSGAPLELPVDSIEKNPFQTRTSFDPTKLSELAQSIRASGVIQPIVVRALGAGRWQLIMGERRLLASREAGLEKIPAMVREVSDEQALEMTIVENLQRADLNPMEQARAYERLASTFRFTQEQMAKRTGKERATVANFLRLLRLPEPVQRSVESGELSFGHARALLSLQSREQMLSAMKRVNTGGLSVRQTEAYVQSLVEPREGKSKPSKVKEPLDANVVHAQNRMQRSLGLRVKIEDRAGRGRVIIEYSGLEDFDLVLGLFDREDHLAKRQSHG